MYRGKSKRHVIYHDFSGVPKCIVRLVEARFSAESIVKLIHVKASDDCPFNRFSIVVETKKCIDFRELLVPVLIHLGIKCSLPGDGEDNPPGGLFHRQENVSGLISSSVNQPNPTIIATTGKVAAATVSAFASMLPFTVFHFLKCPPNTQFDCMCIVFCRSGF